MSKVFWVSWWIREIDDPEVASTWPKGVKGWVSGEDMNEPPRQSWCARVEAKDQADAKAKILGMYGRFSTEVEWRFIEEKPDGWWPPADRFPRGRS